MAYFFVVSLAVAYSYRKMYLLEREQRKFWENKAKSELKKAAVAGVASTAVDKLAGLVSRNNKTQ